MLSACGNQARIEAGLPAVDRVIPRDPPKTKIKLGDDARLVAVKLKHENDNLRANSAAARDNYGILQKHN
jgi:hypothetical protein